MLASLKRLWARISTRTRAGRPRPPPSSRARQGHWVEGSHQEAGGVLALAPMVAPERPYRLYLPVGFRATERLPMVVMLHGCRQTAEVFDAGTRMSELADRERFLVLYPEQVRAANSHRCWNWFDTAHHTGAGEAAIIAGMVRAVAEIYNAEPSRLFVAGLSAGGAMTSILASCHADLFAAFGVHSGLMFQAARSTATAARAMRRGSDRDPAAAAAESFAISGHKVDAVPVIVVHGRRDHWVHSTNAEQIVAQFVRVNALGRAQIDPARYSTRTDRSAGGYTYAMRDYRDGDRLLLRHVAVDGLGHAWSGGDARHAYNDPAGPDASRLIWEFFSLHQRRPARPAGSSRAPAPVEPGPAFDALLRITA